MANLTETAPEMVARYTRETLALNAAQLGLLTPAGATKLEIAESIVAARLLGRESNRETAGDETRAEENAGAEQRQGDDEDDDLDRTANRSPFTPSVEARLRRMLEAELLNAEREERLGPGGTGWVGNESKREETTEWADFLRYAKTQMPAGE